MNDELEELKLEVKNHKNIDNSINESKVCMKTSKTNKELQEDIIRLNEEIEKILEKFHLLNEDHSTLQERNDALTF